MAIIVAALFRRLGGLLATGPDGKRQVSFPLDPDTAATDLIGPNGRPQLPGSHPSEQFRNDDEWRGAIKLARYWLDRLSDADKEWLFTFSPPSAEDSKTGALH